MNERDQRIWRLQQTPGLGAAAIARVLERCGAPDAPFFQRGAEWYQHQIGLPARTAAALARSRPPPATLADLPVRAILRPDADYPATLSAWMSPPAALWTLEERNNALTKGNICVLASAGAEMESVDGVKDALRVAIEGGFRLVAGHNRPVYQWALLAAKRCGAPAVMVLDRGLVDAFDGDLRRDPVAPARIWGYAFEAERCLALSPFRLADGWVGSNSRARDALVVGLSDIIVAFGVRPGGTMHRLCRQALERGRAVYADAGSLSLLEEHGARPWLGGLPRPGA